MTSKKHKTQTVDSELHSKSWRLFLSQTSKNNTQIGSWKPFWGSGGVLKWSWAIGLRPVLIWAPTEPYGPISDQISYFFGQKISDPEKSKLFLKCKSHHLAILMNVWHIWEHRSQKVNNNEPDLRFFHGNFCPVISRTVWKPCPEGLLWMGFTFSLKMVGTKILVPGSWYQDLGTKIFVPTIFCEKVQPITTPPDKVFELSGW